MQHAYYFKRTWTYTPFIENYTFTIPFISIIVYLITMAINITEKVNGNVVATFTPSPWNALLYPLLLIGVDTLKDDILNGILGPLLIFFLMAIIETNIGIKKTLFFLFVDTLFTANAGGFKNAFCEDYLETTNAIYNGAYCCGSFLVFASLALAIMQFRETWPKLAYTTLSLIWLMAFLNDYLGMFIDKPNRVCESFSWHAMNFLLGVLYGFVI